MGCQGGNHACYCYCFRHLSWTLWNNPKVMPSETASKSHKTDKTKSNVLLKENEVKHLDLLKQDKINHGTVSRYWRVWDGTDCQTNLGRVEKVCWRSWSGGNKEAKRLQESNTFPLRFYCLDDLRLPTLEVQRQVFDPQAFETCSIWR